MQRFCPTSVEKKESSAIFTTSPEDKLNITEKYNIIPKNAVAQSQPASGANYSVISPHLYFSHYAELPFHVTI